VQSAQADFVHFQRRIHSLLNHSRLGSGHPRTYLAYGSPNLVEIIILAE